MSSERPSEANRMGKITGSFKGKLSSLLHLSRASIEKSNDNPTRISRAALNMVRADHAPTTAFATEAYTLSPGPPISATVPKQLGSASGQGLETPPTVSDQFTQDSGSGIQVFANAQNILITGGTFISVHPNNTCKGQMKNRCGCQWCHCQRCCCRRRGTFP